MSIFRKIFFLGTLAVLMPSPPEDSQHSLPTAGDVSTPQMIFAASRTASDLGGFCGRQPTVCTTAGFIASKLEAKAKYSAQLLYEWANEASSVPGTKEALGEFPSTASASQLAMESKRESQNTLTVQDLIPDWRNPLASKKG
jgi:hypothetical protein